jgi:hypothetical protein
VNLRIATGSRQHQSGLRTEWREGKQEVHEAEEDEEDEGEGEDEVEAEGEDEGEDEGEGDDEDEVEEVGVRKHKRY